MLTPAGAAPAPPPVSPEVEALRPQWQFYREASDLLTEWSREDTAVATSIAKYPPTSEAEVVLIRRELRRLETVLASMRDLVAPNVPGAPPNPWSKVVDLRDRELTLYRQFYRTDWRENAAKPREDSVWFQASRAGAEADGVAKEFMVQADRFLTEHPTLALPPPQ